jgi:FkbM family methyltransferase
MMSRFVELLFYRGIAESPGLYVQLKLGRHGRLRVPGLKAPIAIRKNPSDYATFREVLVCEDYTLPDGFVPATVLDAGANIGLTSVFLASRFPEAQIISVEPDDENFNLLRSNTGPYPNIRPLRSGVWPRTCFLELVDTGEGPNSYQVKESQTHGVHSFEAVSPRKLMDDFGWQSIDLLKVDIEGAELELFSSAVESWLPHTRMLFVETHDRMRPGCTQALFSALSGIRYNCTLAGENFLIENLSFRPLSRGN